MDIPELMSEVSGNANNRFDMWSQVVIALDVKSIAEVGVFRGHFAAHILQNCPSIEQYYMIDPWRHLADWNKPVNKSDKEFLQIKNEALTRTRFALERRVILQGRSTEVLPNIPNDELDFAYIDGDHTLRGIATDLIRVWPKLKAGGILAGDDFCASAWQHGKRYEPTMVFPFAVHFAEAHGAVIYGLPFNQFAIVVGQPENGLFEFCDLTGNFKSTELRDTLLKGA